MEHLSAIAFTEQGCRLARRIADTLLAQRVVSHAAVAGPERFAEACGVDAYDSLSEWTKRAFGESDVLLFVSATGIAVRAVAPYVADKFADPAVVSIDELGQFAVPLLSGHVGGANSFARMLEHVVGATAVISTATDVNGLFAVDEWACMHNMVICERDIAKDVSSALLAGEPVGFASDFPVTGSLPGGVVDASSGGADCKIGFCVTLDEGRRPFKRTLHLVPRIVTVGAGCRRDLAARFLECCILEALDEVHVSPSAVRLLTSIDVKRDERAFHVLAEERGWPLKFYTADELNAVPGEFASSEFVHATVGTDNVCERAAVAEGAALLAGKRASEGATAAVACDEFVVEF